MRLLIVDDEMLIRNVIKEYCLLEGYEVSEASNGSQALELLEKEDFDTLILDIMMPVMDGFQVLEQLPKERRIPTIVLSARKEEYDKLMGFDLGSDDYVTKPFSPKELMARIKALLKRSSKISDDVFIYRTLEIHHKAHVVLIDKKEVKLTPKEYDLLSYLVQNKNVAISREQLLRKLWGYDFFGDDRTIDTHIKMLRSNLGIYRLHLVTVRGFGYKMVFDNEENNT